MSLTAWTETAKPGARYIYAREDANKRPPRAALVEARTLREQGIVHTFLQREPQGDLAYIAQRAGGPAAGNIVDGTAVPDRRTLTERRRQSVLALMADGKTNAEIAEAVGIEVESVSRMLHRMRKAGVPLPRRDRLRGPR